MKTPTNSRPRVSASIIALPEYVPSVFVPGTMQALEAVYVIFEMLAATFTDLGVVAWFVYVTEESGPCVPISILHPDASNSISPPTGQFMMLIVPVNGPVPVG